MSTYWHLECRKCGDGFNWDHGSQDRPTRPYHMIDLVSRSALLTQIARLAKQFDEAGNDWSISLTSDWLSHPEQNLAQISSNCDHEFEPRNEYGEWASASLYPDGSPQSNIFRTPVGPTCSGRPPWQ